MNNNEDQLSPTPEMDDFAAEFPVTEVAAVAPTTDPTMTVDPATQPGATDEAASDSKPTSKRLPLVMLLVLVVVVLGLVVALLGILYAMGLTGNGTTLPDTQATPTPLPINSKPLDASFSAELEALETQMESADPAIIDLKPPQLDFQIRL